MDRFFADDFAGRLIRDFPPFEQGCAVNESGELGRKATFENVRELGDTYQEADGLVRSPEFLALMSEISGIPDLLYDPAYIGGGTHKNRVGQDLDAHVDFNFHPTRGWHRRLNLIVYLNPEWEQEWGGSIEFHLDPWLPPDQNRVERVLPLANRAVLFETSERSWHGFEQVSPPPAREDLSRRSFAIYLYTVDRPPEETAPPHATVYVERPLPASVKPDAPISFQDADAVKSMLARRGRHIRRIFDRDQKFLSTAQRLVGKMIDDDAEAGLSAEQIDEVRWLLERQDQQLKFLYDRETGFTAAIERLRGLVKEEEARGGLVPLFGPVEQVTEPQGCWSDGWVTSPLQVRVAATEAVQRIRVQGLSHPAITEPIRLTLRVGGESIEETVRPDAFELIMDADITQGEEFVIEVLSNQSATPARLGTSEDQRALALKLTRVLFETDRSKTRAPGGLPIYGPVLQRGKTEGYWFDQWVTSPLRFSVVAQEDLRHVRVSGRPPEGRNEKRSIVLMVGDRSSRRTVRRNSFEIALDVDVPKGSSRRSRLPAIARSCQARRVRRRTIGAWLFICNGSCSRLKHKVRQPQVSSSDALRTDPGLPAGTGNAGARRLPPSAGSGSHSPRGLGSLR